MFCANLGAALSVIGEDPYYANVSLLLHADGTNGATAFPDNSPTPKTVTAAGNAQVSTVTPKFGTGSALFDGSGDYLSAPNSSDWVFGSAPFTIEAWINTTANPTGGLFGSIVTRGAGGVGPYSWLLATQDVGGFAKVRFLVSANSDASSSTSIFSTTTVNTGAWIFVAAVRDGNTLRLFINGVQEATGAFTGAVFDSAAPLGVGAAWYGFLSSWGNLYTGKIDDLRITKGVARYTANFTPPTTPFPNS